MRSRNIKPAFFSNENLADAGLEARLLFIGLWCLADREGRLEDRPRRIKAQIFPYDDRVKVESALEKLAGSNFISRYETDSGAVIQITNFIKHQNPYTREKPSVLEPAPTLGKTKKHDLGSARAETEHDLGSVEPVPSPCSVVLIPDPCLLKPELSCARSNDDPSREESPFYKFALVFFDEMAEAFLKRTDKPFPKVKNPGREATAKKWERDIRLMHERDGVSGEDMRLVWRFAIDDDFWGGNILSAGKLRKQYPQLLAKMNQSEAPRKSNNNYQPGIGSPSDLTAVSTHPRYKPFKAEQGEETQGDRDATQEFFARGLNGSGGL